LSWWLVYWETLKMSEPQFLRITDMTHHCRVSVVSSCQGWHLYHIASLKAWKAGALYRCGCRRVFTGASLARASCQAESTVCWLVIWFLHRHATAWS
jgi:hypothetical protein